MNLPVNMALALLKNILKYSIYLYKGYRENPDFVFIELPIELPIGSCYSGVE